ncbi:hypothetical protein [Pseudomonas sp. W4I3]|uniref:hypothetical protein n=1 Tax=Pseudomonas sp. W4I3 TaxID=3042294 RepID=UPI0027888158|nr:hypothetical protein [Pseudomonas sp. W4I3]MDQ0741792.1 hypothetical protein [Pseudomonas sp. W4I3]
MDALKELLSRIGKADIPSMSDSEALNLLMSITSLAIAALSLAIAVIVLFYAAYQFFSKRGSRFCGIFSIAGSVWSSQRYVGEVILENTKDKSVAINTIYLVVGQNIYVELIDYSDSPRIIAPFETIKLSFMEGVSGYITSTFKVNLDSMLANNKIRKKLVISTPQGLSKVKSYKRFWNIYIESLKNYFIVPVRPVKKYHNGKYYSDALQFIVTSTRDGQQIEEHRLYRGTTYEIAGISVIVDQFASASELKSFFSQSDKSSNILSVEPAEHNFNDYEKYENTEIEHCGFFGTYVLGPIFTKIDKISFRLKNKKNW